MFRRKRQWPHVPHEEIVRRSRILVIDDADFPYLQLFERDGYTIHKWDTVEHLAELESGAYDVILLDLHGVGVSESANQGVGLLNHIRKANPTQIVVAYSNADWSLEYQPFFRMADAALHKTKADYVEFKRTVDSLLDRRFSLGFFLDRISSELGDSPATSALRLKAENAILTGRLEPLRKELASRVEDRGTAERVLMIVQTAMQVIQLWTS